RASVEATRIAHELVEVAAFTHPAPTNERGRRSPPLEPQQTQIFVMLADVTGRFRLIHPLAASARTGALELLQPFAQPREFLFKGEHQTLPPLGHGGMFGKKKFLL